MSISASRPSGRSLARLGAVAALGALALTPALPSFALPPPAPSGNGGAYADYGYGPVGPSPYTGSSPYAGFSPYPGPGPDAGGYSSGFTVAPDPSAGNPASYSDLSLADAGTLLDASQGQDFTYHYVVRNAGPAPSSTSFSDQLPTSLRLVSATAEGGTCSATVLQLVTCPLGTLPAGSTAAVTLTVLETQAGMVGNLASVTGSSYDPNPSNNVLSLETDVFEGPVPASVGPPPLASGPAPATAPGSMTGLPGYTGLLGVLGL